MTYYLKTRDGTILTHTITDSLKKIGEEQMWYSNRGYSVVVVMEREIQLGNQSVLDVLDVLDD